MLFVYPFFLFAISAILIPILIHLFQLRRYKKIIFSDIRFLKQITEQNQKQRNIKEWIILAARCLAIICLVFAFAKPFIPLSNTTVSKADKAISIFIDNSFSMSQQNKEGELLEVAKNKDESYQYITCNVSHIHPCGFSVSLELESNEKQLIRAEISKDDCEKMKIGLRDSYSRISGL
jgi:hypothetical protein